MSVNRSLTIVALASLVVVPIGAGTAAAAKPKDRGFVSLFNGKDLTGWNTKGNWIVEEGGVVTLKPRPGERGWQRYDAYLWAEKKYGDFILDLEYKIPKGGNSGVFVRVADLKEPVSKGIEVQILDSHGKKRKLGAHDCGGVISAVGPSKNTSKPAGQWNRMVVTCRGNRLLVELNGEQIVNLRLDTSAVKDRPPVGYVGLQDHGQPLSFRNVKIKELKGERPGQAAQPAGPDKETWVPAMKRVHAKFTGQQGSFAEFGDSITCSRAFWFTMRYHAKNGPPEMVRAFRLVDGYMLQDCWDRKGPKYGNQGSMTIRWAHENVDTWLKTLNPEVANIMFGTNDLGPLEVEEYETKTREVVRKCIDNGTVVILNTLPPKHGRAEKAAVFAEAVRKIARELKVPLVDYQREILLRRPDDWDGALEKFSRYKGYDVPTLISRDGVHPSNCKKYIGDYSPEGLKNNGFGLWNYLVLMQYAEVIREVLKGP
ncbi:MAG: family 16 glycoside hydrolase [Planctomycetota bacterium]|jgi:hypothetical protein